MASHKQTMTLPAFTHIDKLHEIVEETFRDIEESTKELHMLRGAIDQMSYMSRNSNNELNVFLIDRMASLNKDLLDEHQINLAELKDIKLQAGRLNIDHDNLRRDIATQVDNIHAMESKVGWNQCEEIVDR